MPDAMDHVQDLIENERSTVEASRPEVAASASAEECDDCGAEIPAVRRQAVPGCRLCVECADLAERRARCRPPGA